jgi:hypothetical protein
MNPQKRHLVLSCSSHVLQCTQCIPTGHFNARSKLKYIVRTHAAETSDARQKTEGSWRQVLTAATTAESILRCALFALAGVDTQNTWTLPQRMWQGIHVRHGA